MRDAIHLNAILPKSAKTLTRRAAFFALLGLGVVKALDTGILSATEAIQLFFNADNCLFVRRHLRDKVADEIMGRGVQLSDLFDALPPQEASREFRHELERLRSLCLKLLESKRLVA
jgi:hypothetical protein